MQNIWPDGINLAADVRAEVLGTAVCALCWPCRQQQLCNLVFIDRKPQKVNVWIGGWAPLPEDIDLPAYEDWQDRAFWSDLGRLAPMRRALLGINASVVGILLAALFQPVWQTGIRGGAEFSLALVAFVLLVSWRQPAWRVVLFCAGVGGLTLA